MAQKSKAQQILDAEVLRDETVVGANTKNRVYNLLLDLIESSVNYQQVQTDTGASITDPISQEAVTSMGALTIQGLWSAATDAFPLVGGSGPTGLIKKGNVFIASDDSASLLGPDGNIILKGTWIIALQDAPTLLAHWGFLISIVA